MKGVELTISTLVIVILALVVLLGILALFFGVVTPGSTTINLEAAKNNACQMLVSTGCGYPSSVLIKDFDANKNTQLNDAGDTLAALCLNWYNVDEDKCRNQICMCQSIGGGLPSEESPPPPPP